VWIQFNVDKRQSIRNDEAQKKKAKKKKAKRLIATLLEDKEIHNVIMETADIHLELISIIVNILCKKLYNLQQKMVIFGP